MPLFLLPYLYSQLVTSSLTSKWTVTLGAQPGKRE